MLRGLAQRDGPRVVACVVRITAMPWGGKRSSTTAFTLTFSCFSAPARYSRKGTGICGHAAIDTGSGDSLWLIQHSSNTEQ